MIARNIIFTNSPLVKGFRYHDIFQLVPIFYSPDAPLSKYATHFPAFLEYETGDKEDVILCEQEFREKGIPENVLREGRKIPNETRIRKEILHLLSSLTNFHFFEYNNNFFSNSWGIQAPMKDFKDLKKEEVEYYNNQTSHWIIKGYMYPNKRKDLIASNYTNCSDYYQGMDQPFSYFTNNPNIENNPQIKIPLYFNHVLDRYFSLTKEDRKCVSQCMGLLNDGIELFDTKRSVSLLSIVSSIEGMALLDYNKYGQTKGLGAKNRFLRYLKNYVAGRSEDKYKKYYEKRCLITHEGTLFLSDYDLYGDISIQDEDWRLRLEILQIARLALFNWLKHQV